MQLPAFTKYSFRIRTRQGMVVDNLMLYGRDAMDAERKLKQMYRDCEILECAALVASGTKTAAATFEEVATLISRRDS
ncbi:MAG TPA: hypothetical protein VFF82_05395 [Rhodocyclaceae bacterium]|nr:hypothetical protein [Rhodocyclaceae bacterium]